MSAWKLCNETEETELEYLKKRLADAEKRLAFYARLQIPELPSAGEVAREYFEKYGGKYDE